MVDVTYVGMFLKPSTFGVKVVKTYITNLTFHDLKMEIM
jgi:hypothetical protein